MTASIGERLRPLPARDSRGRFVASTELVLWRPDEELLLQQFDRSGECSFPDPWRPGRYVIETRRSLKGFPVALRYEGPLIEDWRGRAKLNYGCVIKYDASDWCEMPEGEVAVSPVQWYGDPNTGWGDGSWEMRRARRELARLYIHLVHSVDLHEYECGDEIGVVQGSRRREYD